MLESVIQTIAISALPVIFAITLHEAAHGYAARHFGDPTAWQMGRISLNPRRHIDPVGTILIPAAILLCSGGTFLFGYAKPVPVDFSRLRNCLLYTSDAADDLLCVDLGGRRTLKTNKLYKNTQTIPTQSQQRTQK